MDNISEVYAQIDSDLKNRAESILSNLGVATSSAISMFYSQIILIRGLPFELKLPEANITAIGAMDKSQIDAELMKGIESLKNRTYSVDEVDEMLKNKFDQNK